MDRHCRIFAVVAERVVCNTWVVLASVCATGNSESRRRWAAMVRDEQQQWGDASPERSFLGGRASEGRGCLNPFDF